MAEINMEDLIFVQDSDAEVIHANMMSQLPNDIDDMPGGFPYDFTFPSALELSKFKQFDLVQAIMMMFPQYAKGSWLDKHGIEARITRRDARKATGTVKVTGKIGTIIPKGTVFCTPSTNDSSSIMFESVDEALIENGEVYIDVIAANAGTESNVASHTITLLLEPMDGIDAIVNEEKITDGADEEDDETYRERILEAYRADIIYVGNNADYVRWGKEVSGVGNVSVIPEWNGAGTVKLIITDPSGLPASDEVCSDVLNHIMAEGESRKAPIGATVTVVPPEPVNIRYIAEIKLDPNYTLETIENDIANELQKYYSSIEDRIIRYAKIFALIAKMEGVDDVRLITVNASESNISISESQYPVTESISITTY